MNGCERMLGESGGENLLLLSLRATPKKPVGAEEEEAGGETDSLLWTFSPRLFVLSFRCT